MFLFRKNGFFQQHQHQCTSVEKHTLSNDNVDHCDKTGRFNDGKETLLNQITTKGDRIRTQNRSSTEKRISSNISKKEISGKRKSDEILTENTVESSPTSSLNRKKRKNNRVNDLVDNKSLEVVDIINIEVNQNKKSPGKKSPGRTEAARTKTSKTKSAPHVFNVLKHHAYEGVDGIITLNEDYISQSVSTDGTTSPMLPDVNIGLKNIDGFEIAGSESGSCKNNVCEKKFCESSIPENVLKSNSVITKEDIRTELVTSQDVVCDVGKLQSVSSEECVVKDPYEQIAPSDKDMCYSYVSRNNDTFTCNNDMYHKDVSRDNDTYNKDVSRDNDTCKKNVSRDNDTYNKDVSCDNDTCKKNVSRDNDTYNKDVTRDNDTCKKNVSRDMCDKIVSHDNCMRDKDLSLNDDTCNKDISRDNDMCDKLVSHDNYICDEDVLHDNNIGNRNISHDRDTGNNDTSNDNDTSDKLVLSSKDPCDEDVSHFVDMSTKDLSKDMTNNNVLCEEDTCVSHGVTPHKYATITEQCTDGDVGPSSVLQLTPTNPINTSARDDLDILSLIKQLESPNKDHLMLGNLSFSKIKLPLCKTLAMPKKILSPVKETEVLDKNSLTSMKKTVHSMSNNKKDSVICSEITNQKMDVDGNVLTVSDDTQSSSITPERSISTSNVKNKGKRKRRSHSKIDELVNSGEIDQNNDVNVVDRTIKQKNKVKSSCSTQEKINVQTVIAEKKADFNENKEISSCSTLKKINNQTVISESKVGLNEDKEIKHSNQTIKSGSCSEELIPPTPPVLTSHSKTSNTILQESVIKRTNRKQNKSVNISSTGGTYKVERSNLTDNNLIEAVSKQDKHINVKNYDSNAKTLKIPENRSYMNFINVKNYDSNAKTLKIPENRSNVNLNKTNNQSLISVEKVGNQSRNVSDKFDSHPVGSMIADSNVVVGLTSSDRLFCAELANDDRLEQIKCSKEVNCDDYRKDKQNARKFTSNSQQIRNTQLDDIFGKTEETMIPKNRAICADQEQRDFTAASVDLFDGLSDDNIDIYTNSKHLSSGKPCDEKDYNERSCDENEFNERSCDEEDFSESLIVTGSKNITTCGDGHDSDLDCIEEIMCIKAAKDVKTNLKEVNNCVKSNAWLEQDPTISEVKESRKKPDENTENTVIVKEKLIVNDGNPNMEVLPVDYDEEDLTEDEEEVIDLGKKFRQTYKRISNEPLSQQSIDFDVSEPDVIEIKKSADVVEKRKHSDFMEINKQSTNNVEISEKPINNKEMKKELYLSETTNIDDVEKNVEEMWWTSANTLKRCVRTRGTRWTQN